MLNYRNTEIIELKSQIIEQFGIKLLVKREDQNHPLVSGNKWWKLKYNLAEALKSNHDTLLTFGGAYSNHLYATAAAANELGLKSVGIVRGEETLPLNHTLSFAKSRGMELHYVSREAYRNKTAPLFIEQLHKQFGDFYLIPEGGTNELAVKGCAGFARTLKEETAFDFLCLPVGTGGTIAGIIEGLDDTKNILGFPVLKGSEFLEEEIRQYTQKNHWQLLYDYHFGGYAKTNGELMSFLKTFEEEYHIPLDPVYTAKMMFGVFDLIKKNFFPLGSTILVLHTGGLQGRSGFSF
ncbi:MAG: pyridoxal-phosphate dependent enzyme [Cyclobacteriaceae bacterium]|nr:pyridoxal-phosphate dependent enzyme [Cyclobacteriaceae bacterium]